ncbi:MMPL family transporter [Actinocrinis sp.]|uniref:MMPL family transporter n=1 Tax=Actinocrinis sp. TaxID=1920516 RepID=UPI002D3EDBCB|nr:MMPL family transporter [Actinocrinis sp.]HZP53488.1 MMPL family transporter [Actinocrinis sp.]
MATLLYRLGRGAFRWRWLVVVLWIGVLAGVGTGASRAHLGSDSGLAMPGTESQQASDLMKSRFGGASGGGAVAQLVFVAPNGQQVTATADKVAIERIVAEVAAGPQVASAATPFQAGTVSKDASTAYAPVTYKVTANNLTDASKSALEHAVAEGKAAGLSVEVGGNAMTKTPAAGGATEVVGIAAATLILLVTFGALAAAGLPLLVALLSVGIGSAGILAVGSTFGLSETTTALATMLGLAVGIDYAVFIVSRYREERANGREPREAAGLAAGTAGSSVLFAGLTVVIGLAGLSVVGVPMLTKMGLAAAATVVVTVLVALTLVPALLGFWPNAVLSRRVRKGRSAAHTAGHHAVADAAGNASGAKLNGGARWAKWVLRRPVPVLLLTVLGLGVIALPATGLHLGSQDNGSLPTSNTERRAYDDLAKAFGPGFNGALTIVVDAKGTTDSKAAVTSIEHAISATPGVVSVSAPRFNAAGDTAVFSAIPSTGPSDTKTVDLVHAIRAERAQIDAASGATYAVTGATALDIDSAAKVQHALPLYLAVVVGLAFVLLLFVFRSVLVPLKAALGFILSVLAALGAVVAVFQWGWLANLLGVHQTGPIMTLMPIFMVGIIFGLAMDYEVFIATRIREAYVHGDAPRAAIVSGFRASARVVVAAALIMTAVFSGFIGADNALIKMIGFGMAAAVLFDAFVVRMALVPATLALLGKAAWWMPRWLDRVLPRVDVEGEALSRRAPVGEPEREVQTAAV